jgi:hypothetical protein
MKRTLLKTMATLALTLGLFLGCNTEDFNLRTIHDTDREYLSPDSTSLRMNWGDPTWRNKNTKYWRSAGMMVTNEYNAFKQPYWLKQTVDDGFEGKIVVELDLEKIYLNWTSDISIGVDCDVTQQSFNPPTNTYGATPDSGSIDFTLVYEEVSQLYHIINIPGENRFWNSNPDFGPRFGHYTSYDLKSWTKQQDIWLTGYDGAKNVHRNVWAPNIVEEDGIYYMFYTAVDWDENSAATNVQRIMRSQSTDLFNWSNGVLVLEGDDYADGVTPFTQWDDVTNWKNDCRDGHVIRNETDDGWLMFVSVLGDALGTVGVGGLVIGIAESPSLTQPFLLTDYILKTTQGNGQYNGESPKAFVKNGIYYLQWTLNDDDGTDYEMGRVISTTTPSLGTFAGNTWTDVYNGTTDEILNFKAMEEITLPDGEFLVGYLEPQTNGQFDIGFQRLYIDANNDFHQSPVVDDNCFPFNNSPYHPSYLNNYRKDLSVAQLINNQTNLIRTINSGGESSLGVDANDGKGLYLIPNVAALSDTAWVNAVARVVNKHLTNLENYIGANENITYGVMFPHYDYRKWGPVDQVDATNIDPADLGKSLSTYSNTEYDTYIHPYYDNFVRLFSDMDIHTITRGDRIPSDSIGGSLVESREAQGVMWNDVTPLTVDDVVAEAGYVRTAYVALSAADPITLIAGIKANVYNSTPTDYSTMMNKLLDAGFYFTPGGADTYFDYPANQTGDWWVRSDNDSNWQNHPENPVYDNYSVSPRQLINIVAEVEEGQVPSPLISINGWSQGGSGEIKVKVTTPLSVDLRARFKIGSSASWLRQYYDDSNWQDVAYTTVPTANKTINIDLSTNDAYPWRTFHTDTLFVEAWATEDGGSEEPVVSFNRVFSYAPTPSPLPVRDEYNTSFISLSELHLMAPIPTSEELSVYDNLIIRSDLFGNVTSGLDNSGANELHHENIMSDIRSYNPDIMSFGYIHYPRVWLGGIIGAHGDPATGTYARALYSRLAEYCAFSPDGFPAYDQPADTLWVEFVEGVTTLEINMSIPEARTEFIELLYELYTHSDNFVENIGFFLDWFEVAYPSWIVGINGNRWPDYDLDGDAHNVDADEQAAYKQANVDFLTELHAKFSEFPQFLTMGNGGGSSREDQYRSRLDAAFLENWTTDGVSTDANFEQFMGPFVVGLQDSIGHTIERAYPRLEWSELNRSATGELRTSYNRVAMASVDGSIGHGITSGGVPYYPNEIDIGFPVGDPIVDAVNHIITREYEDGFVMIGDYEDPKMGTDTGSADIWIEHSDGTVLYKYPTSNNIFEPVAIVHSGVPTININTEYKVESFTAGELEAKADSLNGEILEPHILWDDYYTQYGDYLTDIRVDDPDHILLTRFNTLYADTDWAILPVGSFYRDFYDLINDGDYWAKSSSGVLLSYNDKDGFIFPTRFIINITKSGYVEAVTDFYTDKLLTSSNALPYTGFLIDEIDYSNFSGRYCYGQNCGGAIDLNENGIVYAIDTDEQALYQSVVIDLVQTLRNKTIVKLQTKDIIIVDKGGASKDYAPLASIMDGTLFYNLNDGLGLSNNQTAWNDCVLQPTRYLSETLSNSMIIMDYSDFNSWDSALTSSSVVGGWASGNRVNGSSESKPDVLLPIGELFGNPFYSDGDTLSLRYDSGTARLVVTDVYQQTSIVIGTTIDDTLLNVGWPRKFYTDDFDAPNVTDVALNCGSDITWYFTWQGLDEPAYVSVNVIVGGGGLTGDDYAGWSPYSAELYDTGAGSIAVAFTPLSDGQYVRGKIRFKDEVGNETFSDVELDETPNVGSAYGDSLFYGIGGCAVIDGTPPAVPSSFIATALLDEFNNPYVAVAWDSVTTSDLNYYTLYRGTTTLTYDTTIKRSIDKKGYTDTSVTAGTEYFYGLTSTDGHNNESTSATEVSATPVFDTTPPANPTGLVDTPADGSILLDWDDNIESDLDAYNVYRGTVIGGPYSRINSLPVGSSTYTDATVVFGTTYFYIVRAYDTSTNESGDSNEVETTSVDLTPPPIPTGVTVTSDENSATLSWDAIENVDLDFSKYIVYRSDDDGAVDPYVNIAETFSESFLNTSLIAGNTYWYEITSVDIYGNESNPSASTSTTITTVILPPIFSSFSIPSVVAGDTNVEVVYVATTSNPTNIKVLTKTNVTAYPDTSTLSWSTMLSSHAAQFETAIPTITFDGDSGTTITWSLGTPAADHHEVQRQTDSGTWVELSATVTGTETSYVDNTATQAILNYRVRAISQSGLASSWTYIPTTLYNEIIDVTTRLHASDGTNPIIESVESTNRFVAGTDPNAPPNAVNFSFPLRSVFFDTTDVNNVVLNLEVTTDKLALGHWEWREEGGDWAPADPQWSRNITESDTLSYAIVLTDTIRTTRGTDDLRNVNIYTRVTLKDALQNVGSIETPSPLSIKFKRENDGTTNWVGTTIISNHADRDSVGVDNWVAIETPYTAIDFSILDTATSSADWGVSEGVWDVNSNVPMGSGYARSDGRRIFLSGGGGTNHTRNFPFFNFGPTNADLIDGTVVSATLWIASSNYRYTDMDTVFIYGCSEVGTPRALLSEWVAGGSDNASYAYSDVSLTTAWTTTIGDGPGDFNTINWNTAWFGVPAIFPANVLNLTESGFNGFDVSTQVQTQIDNGDQLTFFMSFNQINGQDEAPVFAGLHNSSGTTPANLRFYLELEIE